MVNIGFRCQMEAAREISVSSTVYVGALTGASVRLLVNPLDVIKIRWQLQLEAISKRNRSGKYRSWGQTMRAIVSEEGLLALWKGHLSGQLMTVTYAAAQFASYRYFCEKTAFKEEFSVKFMCGGMAGCCGTVVSLPLDIVRTRLISQGNTKVYSSVHNAIISIYQQDSLRGFYRGLSPALLQSFPTAGLTFAFYHMLHPAIRAALGPSNMVLEDVAAGFLSGALVKIMLHPTDVVKKRLQVQGFEEARREFGRFAVYDNLTNCFNTMFKEEGLIGFYKGLSPNLVKGAVATGLHFGFFGVYSRLFRDVNKSVKS